MESKNRHNSAELRWPVLFAVLVIITLQLLLPQQLGFVNLKILCAVELVIALIIFLQIHGESPNINIKSGFLEYPSTV